MAKILYGVAKEGMGHAVRDRVIIGRLSKKHDILVLAGGKQFDYLSNYFKKIRKIDDFDLVYINNSVSFTLTFLRNFFRFPLIAYSLFKNKRSIRKFNPDIVISDFEPLSGYLAHCLKKPLISLDNQHVSTKCRINVPQEFKQDFMVSSAVISSIITNADCYLVTSYFFPKTDEKNVFLFPPIIRDEIIRARACSKSHIIVYQTSESYKRLIPTLKNTGFSFVFYGNKKGKEGNIIFKRFCEKDFIKDLASCKAVITNGGFGLISEAIHLNKPVLSIPIKKQFEQILNAIYLKRLGYGDYCMEISEKKIYDFIKTLPKFRKNLGKFKKQDNTKIIKKIEEMICLLKK